MNITLLGYGRMGKEVEKIARERGHNIHLKIDINNLDDINSDKFKLSDAVIEFSLPSAVIQNIETCFKYDIPIVAGTTGWHDEIPRVSELCNNGNHSLFYASNYSIGVNLFFAINEVTAKLMNDFYQYDVDITESHHIHKVDAPSGTAISIAEIILNELERKKSWRLDKKENDILSINAIREGEITGIHSVKYDSPEDFIELKHHAKNRTGFALGAVMAAEFIKDKIGVYTMRDLLGI